MPEITCMETSIDFVEARSQGLLSSGAAIKRSIGMTILAKPTVLIRVLH